MSSETEEHGAPPALYYHCVDVYNAMHAKAEMQEIEDGTQPVLVWQGMLTALIRDDLRLSVPYYTQITRALRRMGCIRQIRRGGGNSPSVWELIKPPTEEQYIAARGNVRTKRQQEIQGLQQQIKDLNVRVSTLETGHRNDVDDASTEAVDQEAS